MVEKAEKREYLRESRNATIVYSDYTSENYKYAVMHNSSPDGMCFTSDYPLQPGSDICVKPADVSVQDFEPDEKDGMRAEVLWCNKMGDGDISFYGIGIQYYEPARKVP